MGWGLDNHWAAVARERGWPAGVVDAAPIAHVQAKVGAAYDPTAAIEEARAFLADRPYLTREEILTRTVHRRRRPGGLRVRRRRRRA
jgi:hypothetical protein